MKEGAPKFFSSNIGFKRGCLLSHILFGFCIDRLEQMVLKFVHQEGIEEFVVGNVITMLLLYADDIILTDPYFD